ncbi:hypothetical protein J1N35_011046 [Gossypium stocksii]|uniref:Zinc finger PMZ-type domain-containing protein n=1 Tax=Gossypium stocksii TaxID=47602 RepID=A0A9D4ACU5_9ROSI|nr:hypothetical protein J1N35_011046 [Gossypium stocksii]
MYGARRYCKNNKAKPQSNTMHTVCHNRDNLWFHVAEFDRSNQGIVGGQYGVHLRNRTCDCGAFDTLHYPCTQAIASCQNLRLDPMRYVDEVYKIEYMYNVWKHVFPLVLDERVVIVGVRRMTHLNRIKNTKVFVSPTPKVFESHKAMGTGNEKSSPMKPCTIPPATTAYIFLVESKSSGKEMHQAMHSNLA